MTKSSPSADVGLRRRVRLIASIAAAVYAAVIALAWIGGGVWMDYKSERLLRAARLEFSEHLEELIHATQWYQACLVFDALGGYTNATPRSVTEMQSLAQRFYIDELNLVSTNGFVIASNLPKVVGDDWRKNPQTAELLGVLAPMSSLKQMSQPRLAQPFRHGTINPEYYCTYFAVAFEDRSGLMELGFSMDRLISVMTHSSCRHIRAWHFGRHGHFDAVDADGDNTPDKLLTKADEELMKSGVLDRIEENGKNSYRLTFSFAGHLFAAILPEREYGNQRQMAFVVFALTSALLILIFTFVLVRLSLTAHKVAQLHRQAEARAAADLEVARKIQLSSLPQVETFESASLAFALAATTRPARVVGGDYYDFFRAADGRIALVVADVSGKGVPAALFMHEAKHAFQRALRAEGDLAAAVTKMNEVLSSNNEAEMFVTAWFGLLDLDSGTLEYVNAGHNRPYLLPADGVPKRLAERGGRLIGLFPDARYHATRRDLKARETLVLFTDGVTEAMDAAHRVFSERRFEAVLASHPADIIAATLDAVSRHAAEAEQSDDLTLMTVSWQGQPASVSRTFAVNDRTAGDCLAFLETQVKLGDHRQKSRLINAVDELVANVVSYSGAKTLSAEVAQTEGRCRVVLTDDGIAYNPLAHRDPNTHLSLEERTVGGLGILMVKRLVASIAWTREGSNNRTTLVQKG